jgi:hypothetical protein
MELGSLPAKFFNVHRPGQSFSSPRPLEDLGHLPPSPQGLQGKIHETGWWLTYPSEKYESMMKFPIWKNHKCAKPPTRK